MKDCYKKGVPTLQEAMVILKEAENLNPGGWVNEILPGVIENTFDL